MIFKANNLDDLNTIAQELIKFSGNLKFFIFEGDMGAGKTTFIKTLCKTLGVKETVSSPTYSIVNEYEGLNSNIYHFDFYRIKDIQEAYDFGYEEYFFSDATCLVEWPSRIESLLPDRFVKVDIKIEGDTSRIFEFSIVG